MEDDGEVASERDMVPPTVSERAGSSPWRRVEIGLEEAFDEFRRETQPNPLSDDVPERTRRVQFPDLRPNP